MRWFFAIALGAAGISASAQDIVSDVFAGKLVNPEAGQWVWYELTEADSGEQFLLRHAIVGEEKVGRKTGHWVELEVIPQGGLPTVYKMLLTGPANKAKNIHRILLKQGDGRAQDIPVRGGDFASDTQAKREKLGTESIQTPTGEIEAEHYAMTTDGKTSEVWLNDDVRPTGIVRLWSPDGRMSLQRYGVGGEDSESKIKASDVDPIPTMQHRVRVQVGDDPPREVEKPKR